MQLRLLLASCSYFSILEDKRCDIMVFIILTVNIIIIMTDLFIIRKHFREQKFLNRVITFLFEDLKR